MMAKYRLQVFIALASVLGVLVWLDNASPARERDNQPAMADQGLESGDTMRPDKDKDVAGSDSLPRDPAKLNLNPLSHLRTANLAEIVDRPLFSSGRRPPRKRKRVVKAPKRTAVKKVKRITFRLLGVIRSKGNSIALLAAKAGGLNFRVEAGDLIEGWQVTQVEAKHVTLEQNSRKVVLSIP